MKALLLVDIQNDFLPDGALGVPEGDKVIPIANQLMKRFDPVLASRDWHPAGHKSFASSHPGQDVGDVIDLEGLEQILWPDHCVQETAGARFADDLNTDAIDEVFYKGTDLTIDSYSALFDNGHRQSTGLPEYLKSEGVDHLVLVGLATDYCVKYTALDAIGLGLTVTVVCEGVRGIDKNPGDVDRAIQKMRDAGVSFTSVEEWTT